MQAIIRYFVDNHKVMISPLLLILTFILIRFVLTSVVRKWKVKDPKNQKNWYIIARQLPNLILLIGILLIWGQELRDLALSLVAVAAAIVLATKEIILCFMGGLLKVSTKLFEIGDRISVASFRGKVKDHNLLTTELLEIGPGQKSNQTTGRLIKIPNSIFLSNSVSIVPSEHDFILHVITLTLPVEKIDINDIQQKLLKSAQESIQVFAAEFEKFKSKNLKIVREYNLDQSPKVFIDLNSKDSIDISLRLCLPYEGMSRIENDIKMRFLSEVDQA